jgi:hypothetical protein
MTNEAEDGESTGEQATMKLMHDSERTGPIKKKSDLRHFVTIDARFGSDIQCTVAMRLLDQFLATWKEDAESRHKNNSIRIVHGTESALPTRKHR